MSNQQFYRSSPTSKAIRSQESPPEFKFMNTFNNKNLHKIMQLQNKSKFFEGQLSPLVTQNRTLKAQLTQIHRLMQSSTEILRNLLPVPSSSQRKLALQLANIEGVSELIKQDWMKMKEQLQFCYEQLKNNSIRIEQLLHKLEETKQKHRNQVEFMKKQHQSIRLRIQQEKDQIIGNLKSTITQLKKQVQQKTILAAYKEKQLSEIHYKHQNERNQLKNTLKIKDQKVSSLQDEINENLREHEANKKLIIEHHQQLAIEKEKELRDSYQTVIKMREEETAKSIKELADYAQSLQDKVTAKQTQILQLYQINNKYIAEKEQLTTDQRILRQELVGIKQQSYKFSQEIVQKMEIIDRLHKQIASGKKIQDNLKEKLKILNTKIQTMEKEKVQIQKIYQSQLFDKKRELEQKQEQFKRIRSRINNNQKIISILEAQIKAKDKQIERALKFEEICQELQKKIQQYIQRQKDHIKEIQEFNHKLQQKQKQLENLQAEKKQISQKLQEEYKIKLAEMVQEQRDRQKNIQQQHRDYLQQIKSDQIRKDRQYYQHIQSLQSEYQKKIGDLELAVESGKKQSLKLQAQLTQIQINYRNEVQKIETNYRSSLSKIEAEHIQQMQETYKKYNQEMQTMKNLITTKQKQFTLTLKNKQKQHRQQLEMRKKEYDSKLHALQKNIQNLKSNTGIADVENKYKSMLQKMRKEAEQQKQLATKQRLKELDTLKQTHEKSLKQLQVKFKLDSKQSKKKHELEIQQIQSRLNQKIASLSAQLQKNISILTQQLAIEKQSHNFLKASTKQQIKNLADTIQEKKILLQRKDLQIAELQFSLDQKMKQMQKIDELVAEKLKKKKQEYELHMQNVQGECERMISKNTAECKKKINEVQNERLRFTTNLYNDFKDMKVKYEGQMQSLKRKYDELEKLFIERPSRQEDVKKINELMLMKQKMDIEVKQFEKKMVSANQIVKYLNLQLENYKDMYDIFGSDGIDPGLAEKKRQEFENYIRNNLIQLISEPKNKKQQDRSRVGQIRRLMKQRQWRLKTQSEMSRQTIFNQSSIHMMSKVEEEDEASNEQPQVLQYKKGRYVRVTQKKKVNRSQSYNDKLGEKQKRLIKVHGDSNNPTRQLRSNAQMFLSLIHKSQKPFEEEKKINTEYGKMSKKRRAHSTIEKLQVHEREGQKRYQLKDRVVTLQNLKY